MPTERKALLTCPVGDEQTALRTVLGRAGFESVSSHSNVDGFATLIQQLCPDIAVGIFPDAAEATLAELGQLSPKVCCPTVMFVPRATEQSLQVAAEIGVGAYVVDGFSESRAGPTITLAQRRFESRRRLETELERAHIAIAERKLIERAKGILMSARQLSEPEAYDRLRKTAMQQNRRMADVARSLVDAKLLLED